MCIRDSGRLADEVDGEAPVADPPYPMHQQGADEVPQPEGRGEPQRHHTTDDQPDQGGEDVEPVGERVQDLT